LKEDEMNNAGTNNDDDNTMETHELLTGEKLSLSGLTEEERTFLRWKEVFRVMKPGAHLLAFGSTRTYDLLVTAIRFAGFEIRDTVQWNYGCLSEDTEILVDGGWEKYTEATSGRKTICYDVETDTYSWQPIESAVVYDYADTAYRVISDFTDQIVSRNHRCLVAEEQGLGFQLAETLKAQVPILTAVSDLVMNLEGFNRRVPGSEHTSTTQARIEPIHYEGKVWCVKVPTGAFVARRNGKVFVTGNSGFPKSADISKHIDKAAAKREVVGKKENYHSEGKRGGSGKNHYGHSDGSFSNPEDAANITAPATEDAKKWEGWGTSLKPANEPAVLCRKPLSESTVAANVLRWGVGGLNIDGCRVGLEGILVSDAYRDTDYFDLLRRVKGPEALPLRGGPITPTIAASVLYRVAHDIADRTGIEQGYLMKRK